MTAIWYEVLPVTLLSGQAVLICHRQENTVPPWMIPNLPQVHPNDIVINNLVRFFGDVFNPGRTIVHSTSWRYDDISDRLLLTYLAVLPPGNWLEDWLATGHISIEPIRQTELQYGNHLLPPEQIKRPYVVAHVLDHLASLNGYDPAIQAVLTPEWKELLCERTPRPAGYAIR